MSVTTELQQIQLIAQSDRYDAYEKLLQQQAAAKSCSALLNTVTWLLQTEGETNYGRVYMLPDLLRDLITLIAGDSSSAATATANDFIDVEDMTPLLVSILTLLRPHVDHYCDALFAAIALLSKCYQATDDNMAAARVLASFKPEDHRHHCAALSSITPTAAATRLQWHVSTAEQFLACGETGPASVAVKKAQQAFNDISVADRQQQSLLKLLLDYRLVIARTLDCERKFIEAAVQYVQLAQLSNSSITLTDRVEAVNLAITAAILAKTGPQRSAMMEQLLHYGSGHTADSVTYQVRQQVQQLPSYSLLQSMVLHRIVRPEAVTQFESTLAEHQTAVTALGITVLQSSVIDHNMFAISQLYTIVTFARLAVLMSVTERQAEQLAASMIEQGRLKACINQVARVVEFRHTENSGSSKASGTQQTAATVSAATQTDKRAAPSASGVKVLEAYDQQLRLICELVIRDSDIIAQKQQQQQQQYLRIHA